MRFLAVLNKDGGTLKTTDLDAFGQSAAAILEQAGHSVEIQVVEGKELEEALDRASERDDIDIVMAGGGDGTVSAAAARLMNHRQALAILPAGTMNLFARSLQIPLSLENAVAAFAVAPIRAVDIATANGKPFVHQFSVGLHAKLVHLRDKMEYSSRLTKIKASAKAAYLTVFQPPRVSLTLEMDGQTNRLQTVGIGITNNPFGEGHLPYADRLDEAKLGIYVTQARTTREILAFAGNMMIGRWRNNPRVEISETDELTLRVSGKRLRRKPYRKVVDGELGYLEPVTHIKIHPGALKVLVPGGSKVSNREVPASEMPAT